LAFSTLLSCKKPADRSCFKSVGSETTKEISLASFEKLALKEHVRYVLIQDSLDKVVLKGGKNLLNLIETTVSDHVLEIKNKNRCNFLRSYKKVVTAEIHFTKLVNINFVGTEPLTSIGTIKTDYFAFYSRDGAGDVVLDLDAQFINAEADHGWCNYTFTGKTKAARISVKSNSYCDVAGLLVSDSIFVASESEGDIKINANQIPIKGYIKENGNVYYKGTPSSIDVYITGKGQVLAE
jgi:hypothetical protein